LQKQPKLDGQILGKALSRFYGLLIPSLAQDRDNLQHVLVQGGGKFVLVGKVNKNGLVAELLVFWLVAGVLEDNGFALKPGFGCLLEDQVGFLH